VSFPPKNFDQIIESCKEEGERMLNLQQLNPWKLLMQQCNRVVKMHRYLMRMNGPTIRF
jgi:hypothetical protein